MASTVYQRLRRDLGLDPDDETTFPDEEIDDLLDEAAESYPNAAQAAAYARVLALRGLLASAAKLTSYRQNSSSEQASDIFKHLRELLDYWQGQVEAAIGATVGAVGSGRTRRKPRRVKEYPGW